MGSHSRVVVGQCGRCGDIACFDVRERTAQCRGCRHVGPLPSGAQVVDEDGESLESLLSRSNPTLCAVVQSRQRLTESAVREARFGARLKWDGPSRRLAVMRLADVPDDPAALKLRDALGDWERMSLYEQRDLLLRVEQHVSDTLRVRRATAFLNGMAACMPGRWAPLRILLPMAGVFSLLAVMTLLLGEADVGVGWVAMLVLGPLVVLPVGTALLHSARLTAWFREELIPEARRRSLDLLLLVRLLEVTESRPQMRLDPNLRRLAWERYTLMALVQQEAAAGARVDMQREGTSIAA